MTLTVFQALAKVEKEQQAAVLCTIVRCQGSTPRGVGSKMLVYPDGSIVGTDGGGEVENRVIQEAMEALKDGKSRVLPYSMVDPDRGDPGVCGGQLEVFVEPILPAHQVVIIGSGHVGKAVAYLAHWLGFRVAVSDDRPEICNPEAVPHADAYYPVLMEELPDHLDFSPWTYLILTTRGSNVDVVGMPALLESQAPYIGVIGSRRRWETTKRQLLAEGISEQILDKVRSPIGLELNAQTPEEIAVSIMAEILMLRDNGDGKPMSENK